MDNISFGFLPGIERSSAALVKSVGALPTSGRWEHVTLTFDIYFRRKACLCQGTCSQQCSPDKVCESGGMSRLVIVCHSPNYISGYLAS